MDAVLVVGANRLHREAMVAQLCRRGVQATEFPVEALPDRGDKHAVDYSVPVLVLAHHLTREHAERLAGWAAGRAHVMVGEPKESSARGALHRLRSATPVDVQELVALLRRARPTSAAAATASLAARQTTPLTTRELDVLRLMARGAGNTEIAGELSISAHTVRTHAQNILGKLGVSTRFAAVATARSAGMLTNARSR